MEKGNSSSMSNMGTYLGRYPVPITSSCQGLLAMIDRFRDDELFLTAILDKSVIYFSDKEEALKDRVIKDAGVKQNFGCSVLFERSLAELEKAMRMRMNLEIEFYNHRKKVQSRIYEILVQSPFPYSKRQFECIHQIRGVISYTSGSFETEADETIVRNVEELLRLLDEDDHLSDTTPFRVVLRSTVPFHLNKILEKLIPLFEGEMNRKAPDFKYPMAITNQAGYMVSRIEKMMQVNKLLAPHEHFELGMFESYDRLRRIFKFSGLRLNALQERAFLVVEEETDSLKESSLMGRYEKINKAWCNFMTELERDVLRGEITRGPDGNLEFAYYGPVNEAVRHINWRLVHLWPVVTAHLLAFPLFNMGMVNMIEIVTKRFLKIYQMR